MNSIEEWKPICETNGVYEVSNLGNVRNRNTGVIRKLWKMPNGYLLVHYNLNGKRYNRYVHRLVAEAFCEHPIGCDIVNHLDNNRSNNCAENIEWTTQLGNIHHASKQNRCRLNAIAVVGQKNGISYRFPSIHQASKFTGCNESSIAKCCNGKYLTSKGYIWQYERVTI